MRSRWFSPSGHAALLALFCVLIVFAWMTPVFLAGFPPVLTATVKEARHFAGTGVLGTVLNPLFTLFLGLLLPIIDWRDATGWAFVSAVTLSAALVPLWWSIRKCFGTGTAWISIILFSLMPMHWREAIGTGYYPLAFFFLFLGFALFLSFAPRRPFLGAALLGTCFGFVLATTHAFFPFLPWFVAVYLWERRSHWKKGIAELALCGACSYVAFVLPLLPNALQPNMSVTARIASFLPFEENLMQPEELYGDDYAYAFLKPEFDERMAKQAASDSFIERRDNENFRINYGVGTFGFFHVILNSAWLFLNAMAGLFMQETIGGMFLWLFLIPGFVTLYRTRKTRLFQLLGLWLSMEFILRFVFHYTRIHLMDVGWIVAIIAAAGVIAIADSMRVAARSVRTGAIAGVIVLIASIQLIQANRSYLAKEYAHSGLPRAYAAVQSLDALPAEAIIAQPRDENLMAFADRTPIVLSNATIDVLIEKGTLADPFRRYGITHIIGYDDGRTAAIQRAVPDVAVLPIDKDATVPLTPFVRYLLNVIR